MAMTDLVLEGGGAKLPGLVGAVESLADAGFDFHRIAGTSAGAIVGALTAAGIAPQTLEQKVLEQDFTEFEDLPPVFHLVPWLGRVQGLLLHKGMYVGEALHDFLASALADQGVRTWGDLKLDDPGSAIPPERSYRLVVIVSDVSRGRMLRLPWDYEEALGVDADSQSVAGRCAPQRPVLSSSVREPCLPGRTYRYRRRTALESPRRRLRPQRRKSLHGGRPWCHALRPRTAAAEWRPATFSTKSGVTMPMRTTGDTSMTPR